jgi:hypothetical protein
MNLVGRRRALGFLSAAAVSSFVKASTASGGVRIGLEAMFRQSTAVIVAKVVEIDPRAGSELDPLTRISLEISDVIRGKVAVGSRQQLVFRGGELPNGDTVTYSNAVELSVMERYVLFVRSQYYISPLLQAEGAVLRVPRIDGREVVVNGAGQGLFVSGLHGLISIGAVAAPLDVRRAQLLEHPDLAGKPETSRSQRNLDLCSPLAHVVNEFRLRSSEVSGTVGELPIAPNPWPTGYAGARVVNGKGKVTP